MHQPQIGDIWFSLLDLVYKPPTQMPNQTLIRRGRAGLRSPNSALLDVTDRHAQDFLFSGLGSGVLPTISSIKRLCRYAKRSERHRSDHRRPAQNCSLVCGDQSTISDRPAALSKIWRSRPLSCPQDGSQAIFIPTMMVVATWNPVAHSRVTLRDAAGPASVALLRG